MSLSALFPQHRWIQTACRLRLSGRELEVAKSLLDGESEKEIAYRLRISRRTVHTHTERIHAKLGVHSRTELFARLVIVLLTAAETQRPGPHLHPSSPSSFAAVDIGYLAD